MRVLKTVYKCKAEDLNVPTLRYRVSSYVTLGRKPDDTTLRRLPGQYVVKVLGSLRKIRSVQGIRIASTIPQL